MGKGLECADCGREFRVEGRLACSEQVLMCLWKKYPDSTASSLDFVHVLCRMGLQLHFQPSEDILPEVSPGHISQYLQKTQRQMKLTDIYGGVFSGLCFLYPLSCRHYLRENVHGRPRWLFQRQGSHGMKLTRNIRTSVDKWHSMSVTA